MSSQTPRTARSLIDSGWVSIFLGVVSIAGTYFINETLVNLDTGAIESVRIHWMIGLLYNTLGRIPTVVLLGGVAVFLIVMGVRRLIMERTD